MNLVNQIKQITTKKLLTFFSVVFICIGLVGGCGTNSADTDRSDTDTIVSNFILSIINSSQFANACQVGTIQIDSEALPPFTFVDVDFVPGFNTVGACILDQDVVLDENGRAFLEFITDYVVGVESTGSFRILLNAETPDEQMINQFADIVVFGIGIVPPEGDSNGVFELEIPDDGSIVGISLIFDTIGIKTGETVEIDFDPLLGFINSDNPTEVSPGGTFVVDYVANNAVGTQVITATITLITPQSILDQCDVVSSSVTISASVTIVQTGGALVGLDSETGFCADGVDNDEDDIIDCLDNDCDGGACKDAEDMDGTCIGNICVVPNSDDESGLCDDGVDNDEDTFTDCEDNDCEGDACIDGGMDGTCMAGICEVP